MKLPTITFLHTPINRISILEEILSSSSMDTLNEISNRYTLISSNRNPLHHDCLPIDMIKKDLSQISDGSVHKYYGRLIHIYGHDVIKRFVIEDEEIVRKKIIDIINFAFDQLYKIDVIRIELKNYISDPNEISSYPSILYSTLMNEFRIIRQEVFSNSCCVNIIKRESIT